MFTDKQKGTYPWYVSVAYKKNHVTKLIHRLLTFFLGSPIENITTADNCNAEHNEVEREKAEPTGKRRNNNVIITSKRRRDVVLT